MGTFGYLRTVTKNPINTFFIYKVTSFLDFQPFLHGFQSVNRYLNDLWTDVNNPEYFHRLFFQFGQVVIDPTINDSHIENFLKSTACTECPYACQCSMLYIRNS